MIVTVPVLQPEQLEQRKKEAHTRSEPELDAAAGRLDPAVEASVNGAGGVLVEAFDGAQRFEVAVDAIEAAGGLGVIDEPGVAAGDVAA